MADEVKTLGKQFRGDDFPAVKTPEQLAQEAATQAKYNDPNAMPLEAYFALRGITDPGAQAARRRFTSVQQATADAWDAIFGKAF